MIRGDALAVIAGITLGVGYALAGATSPPETPYVPPGIPPTAPSPEPPTTEPPWWEDPKYHQPPSSPPTGVPGPIPTYTPMWHELWSSSYGRIGAWEGYYGWDGAPVCTRYYVIADFYLAAVPDWVKAGSRIYNDPAGGGGDVG